MKDHERGSDRLSRPQRSQGGWERRHVFYEGRGPGRGFSVHSTVYRSPLQRLGLRGAESPGRAGGICWLEAPACGA